MRSRLRSWGAVLAILAGLTGCGGKKPGAAGGGPVRQGDELVGEWWDLESWNGVVFRADRTAELYVMGVPTGPVSWAVDAPGTIRMERERFPATTGTWAIRDKNLNLAINGESADYVRESREERERRLAGLYREFDKASREEEVSTGEARKKAVVAKTSAGARMGRLLRTLGKGGQESEMEALRAALRVHAPDLEPALDARLQAMAAGSRATLCRVNLKSLGTALEAYRADHGRFPTALAALGAGKYVDMKVLTCPVTSKADAYVYVAPGGESAPAGNAIQAYDRDPHPDGKRCLSRWDGSILEISEATFQEAMKSGTAGNQD